VVSWSARAGEAPLAEDRSGEQTARQHRHGNAQSPSRVSPPPRFFRPMVREPRSPGESKDDRPAVVKMPSRLAYELNPPANELAYTSDGRGRFACCHTIPALPPH